MKLTEDLIVKELFDFIVDGGSHGGLSGLEADLYNLKFIKQILENQEKAEKYDLATNDPKNRDREFEQFFIIDTLRIQRRKLKEENKQLKEKLEAKKD